MSRNTRSWTAVLAAPTVSEPNPVPGLPPVIAAKPSLPAEVTTVYADVEHRERQLVLDVAAGEQRRSAEAHVDHVDFQRAVNERVGLGARSRGHRVGPGAVVVAPKRDGAIHGRDDARLGRAAAAGRQRLSSHRSWPRRRARHRHCARRCCDGRRQPAVARDRRARESRCPARTGSGASTSRLVFRNRNAACAATISAVMVPCDPFSRCVAESGSCGAGTNVSPPMTLPLNAGMLR